MAIYRVNENLVVDKLYLPGQFIDLKQADAIPLLAIRVVEKLEDAMPEISGRAEKIAAAMPASGEVSLVDISNEVGFLVTDKELQDAKKAKS